MIPTRSSHLEGKYGKRMEARIKQHFSDIFEDVQTFRSAIVKFFACYPTGVLEEEVYAMTVSINFGKTTMMEYEYKYFDCENHWGSFKAWDLLRRHPKSADAVDVGDVNHYQSTVVVRRQ